MRVLLLGGSRDRHDRHRAGAVRRVLVRLLVRRRRRDRLLRRVPLDQRPQAFSVLELDLAAFFDERRDAGVEELEAGAGVRAEVRVLVPQLRAPLKLAPLHFALAQLFLVRFLHTL